MAITIRRAVKEDCERLLELVKELALYEKAPQEVTVTLDHFVESGFGANHQRLLGVPPFGSLVFEQLMAYGRANRRIRQHFRAILLSSLTRAD